MRDGWNSDNIVSNVHNQIPVRIVTFSTREPHSDNLIALQLGSVRLLTQGQCKNIINIILIRCAEFSSTFLMSPSNSAHLCYLDNHIMCYSTLHSNTLHKKSNFRSVYNLRHKCIWLDYHVYWWRHSCWHMTTLEQKHIDFLKFNYRSVSFSVILFTKCAWYILLFL